VLATHCFVCLASRCLFITASFLPLFAILAPRSAQWKWPHGVAYPILEMLVAPLTGCIPFWHGHSELLVSSGSRLLFDVLAIHALVAGAGLNDLRHLGHDSNRLGPLWHLYRVPTLCHGWISG
jgi:hypothetical protein